VGAVLLSAACQDFSSLVPVDKTHRSIGRAAGVQHHAAPVLLHIFKHDIFLGFAAFNNLFPAREDRLIVQLAVQDIVGLGRKLGGCRQHECTTLIQDISQLSRREGRRERYGNGIGS